MHWPLSPLTDRVNCQNSNSTSTQLNMTLERFDNRMTLVHHPPPPHHTNSKSPIPQLLPTRFWLNLGPSWTDFNCHDEICLGNICPGDFFPYQKYLSCYWQEFYQTLKVGSWDHLEQILTVMVTFVQATFVLATFVHISNISAVTGPILTKL